MTVGDDTNNSDDQATAPVVNDEEVGPLTPTVELEPELFEMIAPAASRPTDVRSAWKMAVDAGRVFAHEFGAVLDIAMMVIGIGLLSIAVATLLDGFGITELSLTDNSGAMFGSALLVGVFGSFALGVANEGPLTSPRDGEHVGLISANVSRVVSILIVAALAGWVAGLLPSVLESLPKPFGLGTIVIEQVGRAGFFFGLLIGLPLAVMLRMWKPGTREDADFAILFIVWLVGTILLVNGALPAAL